MSLNGNGNSQVVLVLQIYDRMWIRRNREPRTIDRPTRINYSRLEQKIKMGKEEKNPNPIYIVADIVEDILVRLPLKPILKFKTVSKQWRWILESKSFAERRKSFQKKPKILAVGDRGESRFEGDAEIDIVYLQRDDATTTTRPSLTCDGLVCIPVPDWIHVLNPSTGEFRRFPSGPSHNAIELSTKPWWRVFPGYWAMGFGKDEVQGSYKVVRMLFDFNYFEILDVQTGEWRKLSPPPYSVLPTRKSACVNGSIYWLRLERNFQILALDLKYKILALDLHTQVFRDVPVLPPPRYTDLAQIVNLEDRLAIADTCLYPEWKLEIWSMDAQEERWTMTYSISLSHLTSLSINWWRRCFTPIAVSKHGNLFLYDSDNKLFKYHPETHVLRCLSPHTCVITPFIENLFPLRSQAGSVPKISTSGYPYGLGYLQPGCVPKISKSISSLVGRMGLLIPNILLTSTLVSVIMFGYKHKFST